MRRLDNRVQFRLTEAIATFLARRGPGDDVPSADLRARDDLLALQGLLSAELQQVRLTSAEAAFLADVVDGRWPKPGPVVLHSECRRALRRPGRAPDAHSFDQALLLAKLEPLGPAADFALCEALAIWAARRLPPTTDGFSQAGLRIDDRDGHAFDRESQQVA